LRERRVGWLLFAVLAGLLVLLAFQAPSRGPGDTYLETIVLRVVAPVTHSVAAVASSARGVGESVSTREELVKENRALRRRLERTELELMRLALVEIELDRLGSALEYSRASEGRLRVADVVYADYSSWLRSLILYTGEEDAEPDQPVVSDRGLVGRVISAVPGYAKVQLVSDRAAAIGAMVRRTRRQGVVHSVGERLVLDYVPLQADVKVGDEVVTSGIDGIYPRGLPVGRVMSVDAGQELFLDVAIEPAVDFGMLDQVYLLDRRTLPELPSGAEE